VSTAQRRAADRAPAGTAAPPGTSFAPVEGVPGTHAPGAVVECGSAAVPGSTPRTFVIDMEPGTPIISANNRLNYYARNRLTQELKAKIGAVARGKIPPLGRADITVTYFSPPRLKRMRHPLASDAISDSDNIAPTGKALVDGIVKAGVFRTDSKKCVREVTYILAKETHPRGLLRLTITEVAP
jgi:hypothetical protein